MAQRVKAANEVQDKTLGRTAPTGVGEAVSYAMSSMNGFTPNDPDDITSVLSKEFGIDDLKSRDGGRGGSLVYVDRYQAVKRVLEATGNKFDMWIGDPIFIPMKDRDGNERNVVAIKVTITIKGLGTREALGVQDLRDGSGEDLIKGAIADGFKVVMSYFGMALELYNPDNPIIAEVKQRDSKAKTFNTRGRSF